jgi:septal ring factor EnvC (AmiA/AmiB activator)
MSAGVILLAFIATGCSNQAADLQDANDKLAAVTKERDEALDAAKKAEAETAKTASLAKETSEELERANAKLKESVRTISQLENELAAAKKELAAPTSR